MTKRATTLLLAASCALAVWWTLPTRAPLDGVVDSVPPTATPIPTQGPGPDISSDVRRIPATHGFTQRTYPYGRADPDAYTQALAARHRLRAARKTSAVAWQTVGPTNVGGRISDVAFDPSRPTRLYAGAATGGVFVSEDRGETWRPIFDDAAVLGVGDLAVDPRGGDTLFVGTGEANGGHNNFAGGGLYRTRDGGDTWQLVGLDRTASIGRVVIDPVNPDRVFAAAVGSYFQPTDDRGLYRSVDGGDSWTQVLFVDDSTGVNDVLVKPDEPGRMLAASWERVRRPNGPVYLYGAGSGIWASDDAGTTWNRLGPETGLPDPDLLLDGSGRPRIGRIGLSVSAGHPNIVYAVFTDGSSIFALYRSDDFGASWSRLDPSDRLTASSSQFSWYFGQVRAHPTDPERVTVLDLPIMTSGDAGSSWSIQNGTHVDHHAMAYAPDDPSFVVEGNDGGIAISEDGGVTWRPVPGLPITQFYEIAFDPTNPERLFGGTQDNGTVRTLGGPDVWSRILSGDGFYVLVDPTDPGRVYAESQFGVLAASSDGGATFFGATSGIPDGEKRNWSTPVVMDPSDPATLYYGTYRLFRSADRALSWSPVSANLTDHAPGERLGTITTIAIAPSDRDVIYVGADDGALSASTDRGATWTRVDDGLPRRWVTRLAVDDSDPNVVYVTYSGLKWVDAQPHVFRSSTGGADWVDISGDLPDAPVNALALDPDRPGTVYIGSDVGAFVTEDDGATWTTLGEGLPAVPVYDLKLIRSTGSLLAGTHGRSMYSLDVALPTNIATPGVVVRDRDRLDLYPNPSSKAVTITMAGSPGGAYSVEVFDVLGRRRVLVREGSAFRGGASIETALPHLDAGAYFLVWTRETVLGPVRTVKPFVRTR